MTIELISEEQRKEFEELARPLIKFLNDNFNPHTLITIDNSRAEILSGKCAFVTKDYWKD